MAIIGSYPCCDGNLWIVEPEKTPAYLPEDCPHCGARVWHVLSKAFPKSYLEADFLNEYEVNEESKTVTAKPARGFPNEQTPFKDLNL